MTGRPTAGGMARREAADALQDRGSSAAEIADFLRAARSGPAVGGQGRLIFALDATMSRQPTWDRACALQSEMFVEAGQLGGLSIKLVYYRGYDECRASRWVGDAQALAGLMGRIACRGGHTQIARVLRHARAETAHGRVGALVFVGDAMEENLDDVCAAAGELALAGCPVLAFQEGHDAAAETALREVARLTRGAWCRFDHTAAEELRSLLRAAAAYAAGGLPALEAAGRTSAGATKLLAQLR
jgi:hypothetical protein